MPTALVLCSSAALAQRVRAGLAAGDGARPATAQARTNKNPGAAVPAMQVEVAVNAAAVLAHLAAWPAARGPASCLAPPPAVGELERWHRAGLAGWWPDAVADDVAVLGAALALDRLRWQTASSEREAREQAEQRLAERKWVDRAKGLVMEARGLDEDDAFRLLRGAAMHAHLKLADLARSVVEAAQWAEAVNRAGQARMLSQRLVKLAAQRALDLDARRARQWQEEAAARLLHNLAQLGAWVDSHEGRATVAVTASATADALVQAVGQVRSRAEGLVKALASVAPRGAADAAALHAADADASRLLDAADALTRDIEAAGGRQALRLVNLCGRQRMLVQRLAKDALLAALRAGDDPAARAALDTQCQAVEAALLELEQAPLTGPEIRSALAEARAQWQRLALALGPGRDGDQRAALAAVAQAADALLDLFDRLTAAYERSLQVLMA